MKTKIAKNQEVMETTFTGKSRYAVEKAIELAKTRDGARWDVSTDVKDGRFAQWKKPACVK